MSLDAIIDKNKVKIRLALGAALVFSLGFGAGYYYLPENKGAEVLTIGDRSGDCLGMFEPEAQAVVVGSATDSVAGSAAEGGLILPSGGDPAGTSVAKAFAGSKNSTLYHSRDCQYVKRIKVENLVWFGSQQEARAAGKQPHSCVGG